MIGYLNGGARLQKQLAGFNMSLRCGKEKRRPAILVNSIDIITSANMRPNCTEDTSE